MGLKPEANFTEEHRIWAICELRAGTEERYLNQKPWVPYFHEQILDPDVQIKKQYFFVADARAVSIFPKNLKLDDKLCIEVEYTDEFLDTYYVTGIKLT